MADTAQEATKKFPCQNNVSHLIPDWSEVVEDVEPTKFDPSKLGFIGFLRDKDKGSTDGKTMRERAVELKANFGLSDVPALLGEDGKGLEIIPADLQGNAFIVLTGTLLRDPKGRLYVPGLLWDDDHWELGFDLLDYVCSSFDRLVSCE